jgi:hypothetical protein
MKIRLVWLLVLALAGAAHAQQFKWVDKDGKVRYGDTPPPGVKATRLAPPPAPAAGAAPAASKDAKGARKGPLTPAEQEQEFRKRKLEAQKAAQQTAQEEQERAAKRENCERAREMLTTLESGQRIARTDAKGERYYLEDAQIAQETVKARQAVQQWCN